ncbi:MAG TPA: cytochrome c biogenesis protein CcsA [Candidatus Aquilonibacter sp.]|nr:cytochrome c biogenesis protein CcsA [Candidatus Aquilonibacter sp.]
MKARIPITLLVAALVFFGGFAGLFIAPDEATMHEIQRIFYFHVPLWTAMTLALSISCFSCIAWLVSRRATFDLLAVAGAEVGVLCCTGGLITGMLWGKPVWGIWWTWDARLTSTFVLWLLYISYLLLRELIEDPHRRATLSAVFGVFAYLDLPIVLLSTTLWRTQHPQPVLFGGPKSINHTMLMVFLLCMVAIVGVMILILIDRYRLERLRFELDELRVEIESREMDAQQLPAKQAVPGKELPAKGTA